MSAPKITVDSLYHVVSELIKNTTTANYIEYAGTRGQEEHFSLTGLGRNSHFNDLKGLLATYGISSTLQTVEGCEYLSIPKKQTPKAIASLVNVVNEKHKTEYQDQLREDLSLLTPEQQRNLLKDYSAIIKDIAQEEGVSLSDFAKNVKRPNEAGLSK